MQRFFTRFCLGVVALAMLLTDSAFAQKAAYLAGGSRQI